MGTVFLLKKKPMGEAEFGLGFKEHGRFAKCRADGLLQILLGNVWVEVSDFLHGDATGQKAENDGFGVVAQG